MTHLFTEYTWQDYCASTDRQRMLLDAVERYKLHPDFTHALEADAYFRGENPAVARKTVLRAQKIEARDESGRRRVRTRMQDVVGNRIGSGFLRRFVIQQNQFLLGNGCILADDALKKRLGCDFDRVLQQAGERALVHGVCWLYWNCDHAEVLEIAKNAMSGFFPLLDELTGQPMAGVQFWQIAPERPLYLRLFTTDGVTVYRRSRDSLDEVQPLRAYRVTIRSDALGEEIIGEENYAALPLVPLMANAEQSSELTPSIRAKIDAYDRILSDFADNLDRANDVYWVLNNFGGTTDDIAVMLEEINRIKAVANMSDGSGAPSTAEPHTIEVPYAARRAALELLEQALYADYMALDMRQLTGGSLTTVAIRAATANLHLKADRYEWEVFRCVRALLRLLGVDTDEIRFQRQEIANESEIVQCIAAVRGDIDRRTALKLNPFVQPDEIEGILQALSAEAM